MLKYLNSINVELRDQLYFRGDGNYHCFGEHFDVIENNANAVHDDGEEYEGEDNGEGDEHEGEEFIGINYGSDDQSLDGLSTLGSVNLSDDSEEENDLGYLSENSEDEDYDGL